MQRPCRLTATPAIASGAAVLANLVSCGRGAGLEGFGGALAVAWRCERLACPCVTHATFRDCLRIANLREIPLQSSCRESNPFRGPAT